MTKLQLSYQTDNGPLYTTVMDGSETGVHLVLIQTFLLYYVNQVVLSWLIFFKDNFHNKAKEVCVKTRSPSASHSLEGLGTKSTTVKMVYLCPRRYVLCYLCLVFCCSHFLKVDKFCDTVKCTYNCLR